jgi:hypothetical protein
VAEQHCGVPVKCGHCGGTFTTRADPKATKACLAPATPLRLDIGAARSPRPSRQGNEDSFLAQHLIYCNLEERHDVAVLAAADGRRVISAVAAALVPPLDEILNGAVKDAAGLAETLATACRDLTSTAAIAVIWDGFVSTSRIGDGSIYHQNGGRLNRPTSDRFRLAAGDWLVLSCGRPNTLIDDALQAEMAAAPSSALELAERLVERAGDCTFVVGRGISAPAA